MASQTHGIQQLLAAEKRAAEKVAEARKRKAKRIKQAREEAQIEIEKYRKERERQFLEYESKKLGSKEDIAARIDRNTAVVIDNMKKDVEKNKEQILQDLLELVYDIKPMVHPNYFVMNPFALRRIGKNKIEKPINHKE